MISETDLLTRFEHVQRQRDGDWLVRCPAHDDGRPSLHVSLKNDRWLLHCLAGCGHDDVLAAARLAAADLFQSNSNGKREIVAAYDYTDESGGLLYQVVRFEPKDFRQRRPDGNGGWDWKLNGVRRVLYRLPKVIEAVKNSKTIYIAEGEKDVHALVKAGKVATCNPGGAGKWKREYSAVLKGAKVIVVADRDEPGREHAAKVAKSLTGVADNVWVVEPAEGKDARDHLAAGRSVEELVPRDTETAAAAAPPPPEVDGAELLAQVRTFITRYMVLPGDKVADLLALWTVHTWTFAAAWATPYLRIVSATPESGKTLLLAILAAVSRNGWHAVNRRQPCSTARSTATAPPCCSTRSTTSRWTRSATRSRCSIPATSAERPSTAARTTATCSRSTASAPRPTPASTRSRPCRHCYRPASPSAWSAKPAANASRAG